MSAKTKHAAAMASGKEITDRIIARGGRCMEQVIDREFAIYAERWLLPNGVGLIAYYGPDYREVFVEAAPHTNSWAATEAALDAAAKIGS
jgi:hypothetical protein